jgi:hypothetical protein
MIVIQHRASAIRVLVLIELLAVIGCSEDERLGQYAQQSVQQQAKQNQYIARQSEAVAQQSQELAEAAHRMVEADAKSRQELVQAQRELNGELQAERESLDRQREDMEQERRHIADTRHRDPIVAAAITTVGALVACLMPLLVCYIVLRGLADQQADADACVELLATELVAEESWLLPASAPVPQLEQCPLSASAATADAPDRSEPTEE